MTAMHKECAAETGEVQEDFQEEASETAERSMEEEISNQIQTELIKTEPTPTLTKIMSEEIK